MTDEERHLVVKAKMKDAEEMLEVAKLNAQYNFYNSAVNRLYYACFHAASAALVAIGIEDVKRHEGVRSMFSLHFIKGGRISEEWSSFYGTMFTSRSDADYDNFTSYTKENVEEMQPMVTNFVQAINDYLSKEPWEKVK